MEEDFNDKGIGLRSLSIQKKRMVGCIILYISDCVQAELALKKAEESEMAQNKVYKEHMRHLATIEKIVDVQPIEGADAIEKVKVREWWCVAKKNEFKVGDF